MAARSHSLDRNRHTELIHLKGKHPMGSNQPERNVAAAAESSLLAEAVARLYEIWTLDCLIEIAYAVSTDFVARPQLYLGGTIPAAIVDLRMSWGTDAGFPNGVQRQAMMLPIFGRSDGLMPDTSTGTATFHVARRKLIDACIAFSERAVDSGIAMLLERVRSALVPLRAHFEALAGQEGQPGKSLELTATRQMFPIADVAVSILLSPDVAKVFGVGPADSRWPFGSTNPDGAKLVESIGAKLTLPQECKLSYTKFILLQRVAQEGARSLPLVLTTDPSVEQELLALVTQVYSWGTSLRDYQQMT
jgi:hypothetical protein